MGWQSGAKRKTSNNQSKTRVQTGSESTRVALQRTPESCVWAAGLGVVVALGPCIWTDSSQT
jgi:hypothetical protein